MDLTRNAVKAQPGRIRRVHPFDLEELGADRDPDFWIEVREESIAEAGALLNEFKVKVNKDDFLKSVRVREASVVKQIVNWDNLFDGGVPVPCTDANKLMFFRARMKVGEFWKSCMDLVDDAVGLQMEEDRKNAKSSSDTISASA